MTEAIEAENAIIQQAESTFIRFTEIAKECGVPKSSPFTWANYHGYFRKILLFGVNVAPRSEYEQFRREHPELIKAQ
jgi:hypothetical protein